MLTLFQVCFFAGLGLIVLSLILGQIFEFIGIDGLDFDITFWGVDLILPFSPVLGMFFFTVFGGIGWILLKVCGVLSVSLVFILAGLVGLVPTFVLHKYVIVPLKKAQNTSAPDQEDLVGVQAVVTETIVENGFGEIHYVINGNSFCAPARSTTKERISKESKVVICWIEDYIFYVSNIGL